MERNEEMIQAELNEAQTKYRETVPTQPTHASYPLGQRVKELQQELSDALSEGAIPCPDCGGRPIGLRHIHVIVALARKTFTYEVGCVNCKDHRAQGESIAEAVERWNQKEYLPPKS